MSDAMFQEVKLDEDRNGLKNLDTETKPEDGIPIYGATKRSTEETCENFKLELLNLPAKPNFHALKTSLEKQFKINPHKIRLGHKKAFVAFKTEKERDDAIAILNNKQWRGRTLMTQLAKPRDDNLAKKRKLDRDKCTGQDKSSSEIEFTADQVNNQVCPLWSRDYEDQLKYKDSLMRSVLNMSKDILKMSCPGLREESSRLFEWANNNQKICCQFDGVERSPILVGYRNKCEFNVGRDGAVGFKLGRYKDGSERVCRPPDNCPILTKTMFKIIDSFHEYLTRVTKLKGYDLVTHEGHYRQITVRCNSKDEYLLIVDLHPQIMTEDEIEDELKLLDSHFKNISQIVSLYANISSKCQYTSSSQSLQLVSGLSCLHEQLTIDANKPLKFRIGPASFFQVNSRAAELLYKAIIELAQLDSHTMVLDVGCGTGTIGLSLARNVNHVIGIEIVPSAIEDAKINAAENGIDNVTYYAGRAEDLISESISILKSKIEFQETKGDIVAIVDPPRVGFNSSFVKTIRASSIKKIVYIACDAKSNSNLISLCRPKSKAYQGDPFVPTRAKAFDLFPHTKCCELILVYERISSIKL